jgi:hypothetical protein
MESNVRMETVHTEFQKKKKTGVKRVFSPKLVLTGVSPPNFGFACTYRHCCEFDTQLHWMVPNIAHFIATLKLQMKQGLQGQTRVQTNGDFEDTFVTYSY